MGNGGINNRKSPCPLRAIKLQAIFFRRSYIYPSRFFRTSSPRAAGLRQPRRRVHPLFHLAPSRRNYLPTYPPSPPFVSPPSSPAPLRIRYISLCVCLRPSTYLPFASPSPLLPVHPRVPRLPLSFFSSPSSCSSLSTRGPHPPFAAAFTASRTFLS